MANNENLKLSARIISKVIVSLLVLILLIVLVVKSNKTKKDINILNEQINQMQVSINGLNQRINSLQYNLDNFILEQSDIINIEHRFKEGNPSNNTIGYKVSFSLKEVVPGSVITVKAINKETNDFIQEVINSNDVLYQANLLLEIDAEYDVYVYVEHTSRNESYLIVKDLNTKLTSILDFKTSYGVHIENKVERGSFQFSYWNRYEISDIEPVSITFRIKDKSHNTVHVETVNNLDQEEHLYDFFVEGQYTDMKDYYYEILFKTAYGISKVSTYIEK